MGAVTEETTESSGFSDQLESVFTANIGRIVAFVLAPVLVVAVPPVVDGLNNVLGTDFSNQQISNIAIATVVGLAIVVYKWLGNRGQWEKAMAELHLLYESGRQEVDNQVANSPAPPLEVETGPTPAGAVGGKPGMTQ